MNEHRFGISHLGFSNYLFSVLICGFILILCGFGFAQQPATRYAEGLDALSDDSLLNELSSRGLSTLLERAFEVNKIPEAQRQGRRSLAALGRLSDPNSRLSTSQRQQLLSEIVAGIEGALPGINDPELLLNQASELVRYGFDRDVNTLEYWGENPRTQAQLRPVAQTVMKMLDRCAQLAKVQAEQTAARITTPNSPMVAKFEQLDQLAARAEYAKRMAAYYLAMSLDQADPQRRQIAAEAIEYLKQFDIAEDPNRYMVRNRMAKLAMVQPDLDAARRLFASILNDQGQPKPNISQQYEAIYFSAVTELLARNSSAAQKGLNDLIIWQRQNPPQDKAARDGAESAAALLQYRIHSLEAELARTPDQKAKSNDAAVAVLMQLLAGHPELREIIYDQLLPKLEDRTDLTKVDPLMLRALVSKGEQELQKPKDRAIDTKALERAIVAASEIAKRRGQPGIDPQTIDASALLGPFFLEKMGRKADAANSFMDYAEQYKDSNRANATLALNNAQSIIGELRNDPRMRDDSSITRAYERFLPLAIGEPFNRREFAFEYARRLQLNGNPAEALRYYRLVPPDDKRALQARFNELVALNQRIDDESANAPARAQNLADIQKLADQVNEAVKVALSQAKNDEERNNARSMQVRTLLLAADLARREQKNPTRALELLTGFEQSVSALPNSESLVNEAMYIRVQSYMAAGKYSDATAELVRLLNKTEGAHGAQIVYNLLEKLNADFDRAQHAGDREGMRTLARNRAELSGFLVKWASENPDANIRKFTYRYRVFDAETQRRAAELEDGAPRQAGMNLAMERYQALQSPQGIALYKQALDPRAAAEPDLYDPQVALGIALVQYELGQYELAATGLGRLLNDRKLGSAVSVVMDDGQERTIDNDLYWEATLKLTRANLKLNRSAEDAKAFLTRQYITWGPRVGGKKWKQDFETLRVELIPNFKPQDLGASN